MATLIEAGKVLGCSETSIRRALVKSKLLLKKYKVVKYEN